MVAMQHSSFSQCFIRASTVLVRYDLRPGLYTRSNSIHVSCTFGRPWRVMVLVMAVLLRISKPCHIVSPPEESSLVRVKKPQPYTEYDVAAHDSLPFLSLVG